MARVLVTTAFLAGCFSGPAAAGEPRPTGEWLGMSPDADARIAEELAKRAKPVVEPPPTFDAEGPRTLSDATLWLHRNRGVSISYEERQPEDPADRHEGHTPAGWPVWGRRSVRLTYDPPFEGSAEAQARALLEAHERSGGVGTFDVDCAGSRCFLVERTLRDVTGAWVTRPALLDARITVPTEPRSAHEALSLVLDEVAAVTGERIGNAAQVKRNPTVTVGGDDVVARTLVVEIVEALVPGHPWRLLCGDTGCMLNL